MFQTMHPPLTQTRSQSHTNPFPTPKKFLRSETTGIPTHGWG